MTAPLRCVVDTNICIKQFIADPLTLKVNQLFDHLNDPLAEFFVPDLLCVECANVLRKYVRANLYAPDQIQADLADLQALQFKVTSTKDLIAAAVQIALDYGITAYDGCYIALSNRVNAPLLTLDERLVNSLAASNFDLRLFTTFVIPPLPG